MDNAKITDTLTTPQHEEIIIVDYDNGVDAAARDMDGNVIGICSDVSEGIRMGYNRGAQKVDYWVAEGYEAPSITSFSRTRWYPREMLDLARDGSCGEQNNNFVLLETTSSRKFCEKDLKDLPPVNPNYRELGYMQVHSARMNPDFHTYLKKLPKASVPKKKERHLYGAEREFYSAVFMLAIRNGVKLNEGQDYRGYHGVESKKILAGGSPPRPVNSYLSFANSMRFLANAISQDESQLKLLKKMGIDYSKVFEQTGVKKFSNSIMSKCVSDYWNNMSGGERQLWEDESKVLQQLHDKKFPGYKYKPQRSTKNPGEPNPPKRAVKRSMKQAVLKPKSRFTELPCHSPAPVTTFMSMPAEKFIKLDPSMFNNNNPLKIESELVYARVPALPSTSDRLTLSPSCATYISADSPTSSMSPTPSEQLNSNLEFSIEHQNMQTNGCVKMEYLPPVAPASPLLSSVAQPMSSLSFPQATASMAQSSSSHMTWMDAGLSSPPASTLMTRCSSPPPTVWIDASLSQTSTPASDVFFSLADLDFPDPFSIEDITPSVFQPY